jgi:hypothetical protein
MTRGADIGSGRFGKGARGMKRGQAEHEAAVQRSEIKAAREVLKPSPVRSGLIPKWFRQAAVRVLKPRHATAGWSVVMELQNQRRARWIDHWGSTEWQGRVAFVCEPYHLRAADVAQVAELADKLGCEYIITPNSWHYPGSTFRVLFVQRQGGESQE